MRDHEPPKQPGARIGRLSMFGMLCNAGLALTLIPVLVVVRFGMAIANWMGTGGMWLVCVVLEAAPGKRCAAHPFEFDCPTCLVRMGVPCPVKTHVPRRLKAAVATRTGIFPGAQKYPR